MTHLSWKGGSWACEITGGIHGAVWGGKKKIKTGCSGIQSITIGKDFREYLVQSLDFATEETEIESKPVFRN